MNKKRVIPFQLSAIFFIYISSEIYGFTVVIISAFKYTIQLI